MDFYETAKNGAAKVDKIYQLYKMESVEVLYPLDRRRLGLHPEVPHLQ